TRSGRIAGVMRSHPVMCSQWPRARRMQAGPRFAASSTKNEPQSNRQPGARAVLPLFRAHFLAGGHRNAAMMTLLRNAANTWMAKLLLVILVVSFAVWGISGEIHSGFGSRDV